MHRQAMTLSALLWIGLTAGCFGDSASTVVRQAWSDRTQTDEAQATVTQPTATPTDAAPQAAAKPEPTQTGMTEPEAAPPDTEQPDTAQPAAASQPGTPQTDTIPTSTAQTSTTQSEATTPAATQSATTQSSAPTPEPAPADDTATAATAVAAGDALADETLAVESANRDFYRSLNQVFVGKASAMDEVWSHADGVICMGPGGGIGTGWDEVQATWQEQAKMKLGGHVDPDELHVTVGADLAIVECYEVGSNRDPLGAPLPVRIRATNSFRKQRGQWKMIGHHTDLLPYLAGPLGPLGKPSTSNLGPRDPSDTDTIKVEPDEVKLKLID